MRDGAASRTAVLVCQGRAAADGRLAPEVFRDPVAIALLREDERVPVEAVRAGAPPKGWPERMAYEMVRGSSEVALARSVAIDDAVRSRPSPQLVLLGAGLDDRAWRMPELAAVDVFEVDHPASQRDKLDRLGDLVPVALSVRFAPVDLAHEPLDRALAEAGHRAEVATTWIWEGVVPYLTRPQVAATVKAVANRSAPGSRLIVNYQAPSASAVFGRLAARTAMRLARQPDVWASEPHRSAWTPATIGALLAEHGFTIVSDTDLLTVANGLGVPVAQPRSLRDGRVAVAGNSHR
ncbi:MAG: class I SAM-dependent methyltransferase [Frankia sp.]